MAPRAALAALILMVAAACGTDTPPSVSGVVIDVTGDITTVEEFVLRLPDGFDQTFVPAPGITFHSGASIGHLRDHMRSGRTIVVTYEILDSGTWVALSVDDA